MGDARSHSCQSTLVHVLASQVFVSLSFLWCLLSCCWWPGGPAVGGRVSPPSPVGPEVLMGKELRGHSRGRGASILTRKQLAGPKPGSIAATCWVHGSPASVLSPVDTQQLHQAVACEIKQEHVKCELVAAAVLAKPGMETWRPPSTAVRNLWGPPSPGRVRLCPPEAPAGLSVPESPPFSCMKWTQVRDTREGAFELECSLHTVGTAVC